MSMSDKRNVALNNYKNKVKNYKNDVVLDADLDIVEDDHSFDDAIQDFEQSYDCGE